MIKLNGRIALVTGGGRGIGRAVSLKLAAQGAKVIVNFSKSEQAAGEVRNLIRNAGGEAEVMGFDVADTAQADKAVKDILAAHKKIDILVNNAGITRDGLLLRMKDDDWNRVLEVNLKGAFNLTRAAARGMLKEHYGRIINVSSVVGESGNPGQANYCAAKAGLLGLTKSVARELASRQVTVNAVAPGLIETDMLKEMTGAAREEIMRSIPLGRMGLPEEVAAAVCFLASEEAGYITGQVINVNGGMYM